MSVIINLFGLGVRCWISEIPVHRYNQLVTVAKFKETSLNNVVFDLGILENLGYSHWSNIYPIEEINGFVINQTNIIEIKNRRRVISKFNSVSILGTNLLFNIYNSKEMMIKVKLKKNCKYLLIGQEETGCYKYNLTLEELDIDKLNFYHNKAIYKENIITSLAYNEVKLKPIKEDTVVRSFFINYPTIKQ